MQHVMICFLLLMHLRLAAQYDPCQPARGALKLCDSVTKVLPASPRKALVRDWTFMASVMKNNSGCKWSAQSNFKQMLTWNGKLLHTECNIFDETVLDHFPDSQTAVSRDLLRAGIETSLNREERNVKLQTGLVVHTRKFPEYESRIDSNNKHVKYQVAGLFSTMQIYPALGLTLPLKTGGKIDLGLLGVRINMQLYNRGQVPVPLKQALIEGGPRMQISYTRLLFKLVEWDHFTFSFWNIGTGKPPELEFRNLFTLKAGSHLKAGILTRFTYQSFRWPPADFSGELSLGFRLADAGN
jgi:hypothetical protein